MTLVFGSKEANEQLERDKGRRLAGLSVYPTGYIFDDNSDTDADRYCPTCGGYMDWVDCWQCGGKGGRDGDDLMDEDPFWYCEDDWEDCDICEGKGGYWECAGLPHDPQPQGAGGVDGPIDSHSA